MPRKASGSTRTLPWRRFNRYSCLDEQYDISTTNSASSSNTHDVETRFSKLGFHLRRTSIESTLFHTVASPIRYPSHASSIFLPYAVDAFLQCYMAALSLRHSTCFTFAYIPVLATDYPVFLDHSLPHRPNVPIQIVPVIVLVTLLYFQVCFLGILVSRWRRCK
jgi:hypothetical protein